MFFVMDCDLCRYVTLYFDQKKKILIMLGHLSYLLIIKYYTDSCVCLFVITDIAILGDSL